MRSGRALLATLLVTLTLLLPALADPSHAAADEPDALVRITLDSFTPSAPKRDSTITVTGRVTNVSKKPILHPRAYFWRNQAPITDREGFDQALESFSNEPLGARKIASFADLYPSAKHSSLAVGGTAAFSLTVKVADLDLSPTPGVYLMGVHVLQNGQSPAIGRARVFVPILSKPPRNTVAMTSIVALNSRPSLVCSSCSPTHHGVFLDHHLADELARGGRLDALLTAAEQRAVTFAVDPALVEEVTSISLGYQIQGDAGAANDGPGRADAAHWLQRLTRLTRDHDGYRLLYGSVDLAGVAHGNQQSVLEAAERAAQRVPLTAALPLLVWPASGLADPAAVTTADALHPAAVLLSDSSTRSKAPLLQGVGEAPIVNYTATASAGGPGPQPSDTAVHLQQRLLSESYIEATTHRAGTTLGRVRLVTTAAEAAGDDEAVKAPWVSKTTLTQLLAATPRRWSQQLHYSQRSRDRELDGAQLGGITQLARSWATWRDLLVDPGTARVSSDGAVARAASARWRGDDAGLRSYLTPQQAELDARLNAIQISVTAKVLTPKSQVRFPVTILNTLPVSANPADATVNAVRVRLDFASANRQRLTVQPIVPRNPIPAGGNYPGQAAVDARTNGTVRVTAQLHTISGLPVGRPAVIDVQATQAGTVGWFIAIAAGIVLVGTTALRIRQVTRERARAAAAAPTNPTTPRDSTTNAVDPNGVTASSTAHPDPATPQALPALSSAPPQEAGPPDSSASIDV